MPDVPFPSFPQPVTVVDIVGLSASPFGSTPADAGCRFDYQLVLSDGRTVPRSETLGFPGWEQGVETQSSMGITGDNEFGAYPYTLPAEGVMRNFEGRITSHVCRWRA